MNRLGCQTKPCQVYGPHISPALEAVLNTALLLWGVVFSSAGLGFFMYGKKQKAVVPLVCGLALMVFPYFIANTLLLVAIGVALMALPYFVSI